MKVRISKYNPQLRSEEGAYFIDDWTSVSDIGKFPGLTIEKYLEAEDGYWKTLASILSVLGINKLRIAPVAFYDDQPTSNALSTESWLFCREITLKELSSCGVETVEKLFRSALREVISFQALLDEDHNFCAECGYDFYMYVEAGSDFNWVEVPGIFVEVMADGTHVFSQPS